MSKYAKNLAGNLVVMIILISAVSINWLKPLYLWFGDKPLIRFIWLGLFFIILDIFLEVISKSVKDIRLMTEMMGFAKDIRKISAGSHVVSKFILPNRAKTDFIAVGSSGVWLITVKDNDGKLIFNGDELLQDGVVQAGLITKSLEKAYALSSFLKEKLGRDIKVAPVIAFSSPQADLSEVQKSVRGVFISSRKDIVSLIENTDFQLIDTKTVEEIYNLIKK